MAILYDWTMGGGGVATFRHWGTYDADSRYDNLQGAQTFVQNIGDLEITKITLELKGEHSVGPAEGNVTLLLKSGSPTGSVISTCSIDRTTITNQQNYSFELSPAVTVESGVVYCIVLSDPSGSYKVPGSTDTDYTTWFGREGISPPANHVAYSKNDSMSWTANDGYILSGYLEGPDLPTKPVNPTPENDDTGVDFSGFQLSWEDGGGADTYNVYMGESGDLTLMSSAQAGVTYTTSLAELETVFESLPINQKVYWRVDATNDAGTTTGDEWNFDARPGKAKIPIPEDGEEEVYIKGIDRLKELKWQAPD